MLITKNERPRDARDDGAAVLRVCVCVGGGGQRGGQQLPHDQLAVCAMHIAGGMAVLLVASLCALRPRVPIVNRPIKACAAQECTDLGINVLLLTRV